MAPQIKRAGATGIPWVESPARGRRFDRSCGSAYDPAIGTAAGHAFMADDPAGLSTGTRWVRMRTTLWGCRSH